MKFKTNKLSLKVIIASAMLAASLPALAVTGDTDQPIHIESDTQSLDMQGNVVTFTGNVVMTQGTIKINADKVVVPVKGRATHMHYELAKDLVILTGNAYLEQLDSNITGDQITYLVKEQKMQASSEKGKRVTTVLVPSQLQDKGKGQAPAQKKSN
ncbi:MAG: LptA/OstA family protein [Enterobacter sp.]|nr:LptA/OstA family protein [Enterobacter sp.]